MKDEEGNSGELALAARAGTQGNSRGGELSMVNGQWSIANEEGS
jgi:hypothetical protein